MEEQAVVQTPAKSKWPLIAAVVVVVAVAIVAFLVFGRGPASDPARFLPKEVAVAATVDLTSSADKQAALDVIRSVFKDAGIDKPDQELFKLLGKELNLNFEKDVIAHLSGTGGFAMLTEMNGMMPVMVAVICAKTDNDAASVIKIFEGKLSENKVGFQTQSYKGIKYYRISAGSPTPGTPFGGPKLINYVGAAKSVIVWANSDGGFKKVIDTINGEPCLLADSTFTRLRRTDPSTFALLYVSGPGYYKLMAPIFNMSMGMMGGEMPPELKEQMENALGAVCTADADAEGLRFKMVGLTKKPGPQYADVSLDDMATEFPADAKIAFALKGWDRMWPEFKKAVLANPTVKNQTDKGLAQARQMLGFDPLADLLDRITALSAYYTPGKAANASAMPGAATLVLTVDKPGVVNKSIEKLQSFAAASVKSKVTKAKAADQAISVMSFGDNVGKLGDAVVGDKVILTFAGSDIVRAAGSAISAAQHKGSSLADSAGYKLVKGQLPDKGMVLFYGDIGGIADVFKSEMPAKDRKQVEAVFKRVGLFGASGNVRGTESESITVVPFKK